MKDAVRGTQDGVVLELEISPGAKKTELHGYNQWRKRIDVRVSKRAEKGKANEELISFFAGLFKVNSRNIQIITGLTNSRKSLKILGLKTDDVLKLLSEK